MLDIIFTIGTAISAGLFIYGAYLAIQYVLFHEHIATTSTADELHRSQSGASRRRESSGHGGPMVGESERYKAITGKSGSTPRYTWPKVP
jgi:hypothetical protein